MCECVLKHLRACVYVCVRVSVIGWLKPELLCRSGGVYVVLRDLSLSVCVVAHGKLEVCAAERSRYLKVNEAGKIVLFVLSGQCHLMGSLKFRSVGFNRWNEDY